MWRKSFQDTRIAFKMAGACWVTLCIIYNYLWYLYNDVHKCSFGFLWVRENSWHTFSWKMLQHYNNHRLLRKHQNWQLHLHKLKYSCITKMWYSRAVISNDIYSKYIVDDSCFSLTNVTTDARTDIHQYS